MITPAVEYYTNRKAISFTKDGAWKTVSLAGIVSSDAVMVVLQGENTLPAAGGGNARLYAAKGMSYSVSCDNLLQGESDVFSCCALDGSLRLKLKAQDSNVSVYALAAFRGPGAFAHADPIDKTPTQQSQLGTWYNAVATLGLGVVPTDVEAVVIANDGETAYIADWGVRWLGSTVTKLFKSDQTNRCRFVVCKVEPFLYWAWYQLYTTGKYLAGPPAQLIPYSRFCEIGFIKKGYGLHGIEEISNESPGAVSSWTLKTVVAPDVLAGAEGVFGMTCSTVSNPRHGLRTPGSTDPWVKSSGNTSPWAGCNVAMLNPSTQYEYYLASVPELWIYAFTTPLVEVTPQEADALIVASGQPLSVEFLTGFALMILDAEWLVTEYGAVEGGLKAEAAVDASCDASAVVDASQFATIAVEALTSLGAGVEASVTALPCIDAYANFVAALEVGAGILQLVDAQRSFVIPVEAGVAAGLLLTADGDFARSIDASGVVSSSVSASSRIRVLE